MNCTALKNYTQYNNKVAIINCYKERQTTNEGFAYIVLQTCYKNNLHFANLPGHISFDLPKSLLDTSKTGTWNLQNHCNQYSESNHTSTTNIPERPKNEKAKWLTGGENNK